MSSTLNYFLQLQFLINDSKDNNNHKLKKMLVLWKFLGEKLQNKTEKIP